MGGKLEAEIKLRGLVYLRIGMKNLRKNDARRKSIKDGQKDP